MYNNKYNVHTQHELAENKEALNLINLVFSSPFIEIFKLQLVELNRRQLDKTFNVKRACVCDGISDVDSRHLNTNSIEKKRQNHQQKTTNVKLNRYWCAHWCTIHIQSFIYYSIEKK